MVHRTMEQTAPVAMNAKDGSCWLKTEIMSQSTPMSGTEIGYVFGGQEQDCSPTEVKFAVLQHNNKR